VRDMAYAYTGVFYACIFLRKQFLVTCVSYLSWVVNISAQHFMKLTPAFLITAMNYEVCAM